ncbi:E3 ubiquitin-protein ligase [Thalictrum thalictroides]|uniref:E3 ubiquitin-protein ligase RMA n=1 Tax=Thalictrum thalictroides TaxID=46969 RepID=A0A7J6X4S6_THATH|nr:E3 ubiquitin-protein ligase [Thalictrum thalictroides]
MADEGNRRMDLNLYLGLPRRRTESSDLGSDLALGSLPLSEEMSSSNTQSYPPVSQPIQPHGEIIEHGSFLGVDYSLYSPSYSPPSPISQVGMGEQTLGLEVADAHAHAPYSPSFVQVSPPTAQDSTEAILEGSSSNHGEYVPYSVSYVPATASMSLPDELLEVQEENTHVPYIPVPPITQANNDSVRSRPLVPAAVGFRSYQEVEDGSLRREYLQFPEFRFRRLFEANRRVRVRRHRPRVPYGVDSDSSAFSTGPVHSNREARASEGLTETNSLSQKASSEAGPVEDLEQEGKKDQSSAVANFDCNVCLDVAQEPVVTSCGHLFCWPCLFQWLHIHCDHRECPVCKGEVAESDITPIYGRGSSEKEVEKPGKEADSSLKIPPRPHGRRLESLRQRISRPLSRRPREEINSWRFFVDEEMHNRSEELEEPPMLGTFEGTTRRRMLSRLMAAQRVHREDSLENMLNFAGNASSSSANEVANNELILDRIQGLGSSTHPVLARRGIDFWRRFSFNNILSTDRLTAIASDLSTVVEGIEAGVSNSGAAASTSATPRSSRSVNGHRPVEAAVAADQAASASSTIAVIQGDSSAPVDPTAEPSSVGSSRTLRRRRRNTVSGSLDIDGGNHACKRRRLN